MQIPYELWQRKPASYTDPLWGPYEQTYAGEVPFEGDAIGSLEELFRTFNINHPADFRSHSLSVGDRIVLGGETTFECASIGWEPVEHPELAPETVSRYFF
jgi:hypothetical protein